MSNTLLYSVLDNVATITFNRPAAMNSFNKDMADELLVLTTDVKADKAIRAVLLNGAGPLFMAGGDINFFYESLETMPNGVLEIVRTLNQSITNLMFMPKPVIASVHGSVAGVGMGLMMACDLVIAAENTKFNMAYSGIGISPDGGVTFNLPRLVGTKKALEWILLSGVFDAVTAQTHGLINWVVAPEILQEETKLIMKRLAKGPTLAYAQTKRLVNSSWHNNLETQLENEGQAFTNCTSSTDFKTGVTAFLQKSKPTFRGE